MNIFKTLTIMAMMASFAACAETDTSATVAATDDSNPVVETIMARRSIRNYQPQTVGRDTLKAIMTCGINAANGQNLQSWEVRVVDNPATMSKIKEIMASAAETPEDAERATACFRGAPVMVFIARDLNYPCSAYDCGLLAGNMMLAATSMGIGSICVGSPAFIIINNEACAPVLELLGFSQNYELSLCVGLGYANEAPEAKPRDFAKVRFLD